MEALTERQLEVIRLVAEGLTNPEIAERLDIGTESVKSHVSVACRKLGARDRTNLVHLAHIAGYFLCWRSHSRDGGPIRVRSRNTAGSRTL